MTEEKTSTEVQARVTELQGKVQELERELRTLEGRIANRSAGKLDALQRENRALHERWARVQVALAAANQESFRPRTAEDQKLQFEILRQGAVEFCKHANIDPEIWKSIAF